MSQPLTPVGLTRGLATPIRVVIVEDRPTDAELMVIGLENEGYAPEWQRVETGLDLVVALASSPDLVLSDWRLPGFSGLGALAITREQDPDLPFIIVSGSVGEETAVDAMHLGADDYVLKDRLARLGPAVRRVLEARRAQAERRRAADQLAFQASVLANVRESVVVSDPAGIIIYWNDGATATYGWTADEMLGHSVAEIAAATPDETAAELASLRAGESLAQTWPARHKDGRLIWIESQTRPMTNEAGEAVGIIGVSRDVTEQRRIALERERLAAAIEQAEEVVLITDADARIQYVNPAFERVTGYARSEALGQNPRILKSGAHPPAFYRAMWTALTAGLPWVAEFTNRRKDGSEVIEQAHISPIRGPGGDITSFVAVKHDVTRQRGLEQTATRVARERALISDTLGKLPPGASLEETAGMICAQVGTLSGLAAVAVTQFDHDAIAVPLVLVTADGVEHRALRLSAERSRHLHDRAQDGAWVEAWTDGGESDPYRALHASLGTTALAEVPIRQSGQLVGVLAAFSAEAEGVDRLTDILPALAEFAGLAGVVLGPGMAERIDTNRAHDRIHEILEAGAYHPVFQPVVDMATLEVIGFEALTRFDSGERPDVVFGDAWSVGLGRKMEMATLRAAMTAASALPSGRWLSVNASPGLLAAGDEVGELLRDGHRPIVIEVTEHERVADYDALREAIRGLGNGIRLAVDDAGAGSANFAHIVGLRPDLVKLDMGLVRGINRDLARQALAVGLHHFARAAGCQLLAEGIETPEEAETLAALGVELGQGYLYGRPAAVEHWQEWPASEL